MESQVIFTKVLELAKPFVKEAQLLAHAEETTDLIKDLRVNSARFVDFILKIESTFDVQIDDDTADNIHTLGDAVRAISARMA